MIKNIDTLLIIPLSDDIYFNNVKKDRETVKLSILFKKRYRIYEYFFSKLSNDNINSSANYTSFSPSEFISFQIPPVLSMFKKNNLSYHIADRLFLNENIEDFIQKLSLKLNPVTVGISTSLIGNVFELSEFINLVNKIFPYSKIILGGSKTQILVEHLKKEDLKKIYACVYGDGEIIFADIVKNIVCKNNIDSIKHKCIISDSTYIFKFNTNNESLDNYPFPKLKNISNNIKRIFIEGSRGCPFNCAYCRFPTLSPNYRIKSAKKLFNTINQAYNEGVNEFFFFDTTFSTPLSRFNEILDKIIESKINISWYAFVRASDINEEIAIKMAKSGCKVTYMGIESTKNSTLQKINKKVDISQIKTSIELLRKNKIIVYGSFIIGLPDNTTQTPQDIYKFIKDNKIDVCDIYPLAIEPDTPIYKNPTKYGYKLIHNKKYSTPDWESDNLNAKKSDLLVNKLVYELEKNQICLTYNFILSLGINTTIPNTNYSEHQLLFKVLKEINAEIFSHHVVSSKNTLMIKNIRKIINKNTLILEKFFIINQPSQAEIWHSGSVNSV
ncbi:MAG: radical SAM protein [Candidatus Muirbacterium halophilum]|nr:radical SAM protein [Candidatus Muirbacterium halophilum]MCK9476142.1 radical SAM protein [Candidatus Muirbacterium halophilum]